MKDTITVFRRIQKPYRGFSLELVQGHVTVYQGRRAIHCEHEDWDGQNGWKLCKAWIDKRLDGTPN
tara:strand:+ start:42 stop:239 length:198 start_codon:yes stop_codon:yes gene_type:complete